MKRTIGAFILAMAIGIALVSPASAGGWSAVSVDELPGTIHSGEEFSVTFSVLQHGMSPMDGLHPAVTFTNPETGETVVIDASPTGQEGQYAITTTLPESGAWHWNVDAFEGEHGMAPFEVGAAEAAGSSVTSVLTAQPVATGLLALGVLAGIAAAGLTIWPVRQLPSPFLRPRNPEVR